jgi:hypothetical protein
MRKIQMNERIKELATRTVGDYSNNDYWPFFTEELEKFAELIVAKVLDEVATRAYVSGDRAWSDDVDRPWIELEFGYGKLAELKNERY